MPPTPSIRYHLWSPTIWLPGKIFQHGCMGLERPGILRDGENPRYLELRGGLAPEYAWIPSWLVSCLPTYISWSSAGWAVGKHEAARTCTKLSRRILRQSHRRLTLDLRASCTAVYRRLVKTQEWRPREPHLPAPMRAVETVLKPSVLGAH